jgi:hypothetical protein
MIENYLPRRPSWWVAGAILIAAAWWLYALLADGYSDAGEMVFAPSLAVVQVFAALSLALFPRALGACVSRALRQRRRRRMDMQSLGDRQ